MGQASFLVCFRRALHRWPMSRLAAEFHGPIRILCQRHPSFADILSTDVTKRAMVGLRNVEDMIWRLTDPPRAQREFLDWAKFVRSVGSANLPVEIPAMPGLLALEEPDLQLLRGGTMVSGSLSHSAARITPGTPEFPLEYRPRIPVIQELAKELLCVILDVRNIIDGEAVR